MTSSQISEKLQRILSEINSLKSILSNLPEKDFFCCHQGKYSKWFISQNHQNMYLPKKERATAEQLALRKYILLRLSELKKEYTALTAYKKLYTSDDLPSQKLLLDPAYKELLRGYFKPVSTSLAEWCAETYDKNPKYPERLIYKSISGNYLRSKSEAIIDMLLYQNKIPFRYECALDIYGTVIYPDFTIRHPADGRVLYWEHFGLMDNSGYQQQYIKKMQLYIQNQIIPSIHLICTYETSEYPLSPEYVQRIIDYYFFH